MPLFERQRFVWNEPWFFQQRIRTVRSWINLILFLGIAAIAVSAVFYISSAPGQAKNWIEIIGMGLGFAAALWWVFDGVETRRQAVLLEDSIVVGGDMGKYSQPTTYKLSQIGATAIVLPDESKWPEPALFFLYEGEEQAIGIDQRAGLTRVAQAIHDVGLPVRLDGWKPDQDSAFKKAYSWHSDSETPTGQALIEELPAGTPGLMNVSGITLAIFQQCWALGLWLALTVYLGYYGYQNWNDLGLLRAALLIIIPIATLYVAGTYTDRVATAATSQSLTSMALSQLRKRNGVAVDLDSDNLMTIEILKPDQIEKTIQVIYEMGFLQVDKTSQALLFEGKKQRWSIPASSIQSLALEEVQTGTPGQSALGALNYFVRIRFKADEEWDLAIRNAQRDFGEFGEVKRAEGAIFVYEQIESILGHHVQ